MDAMECLLTRRSIRKFEDRPVSRALVAKLLQALFSSPSAMDARPWSFVIVDDREVLRGLGRAMPHCDMLLEAPLGIVICGEPARERAPGFWPQDCSAATQNVLLAAHALGLGGVWVGLYPMDDRVAAVRRALEIPETVIPFALAAIGHPAEHPAPENRFDAARVHHNRWGRTASSFSTGEAP